MSKDISNNLKYDPSKSDVIRCCIWCGERKLSSEHLWPKWFSKIVRPTGNHHLSEGLETLIINGSLVKKPIEIKKRAGPVSSKKIRAVCPKCNNEWMSKIDNRAKEILTPIILKESEKISYFDLKPLTNWLILKTIVEESTNLPHQRPISRSAIDKFYDDRTIEGDWGAWIGRYAGDGPEIAHYHHHSRLCPESENAVDTHTPIANIQITTFLGRGLIFQAWYSKGINTIFPFEELSSKIHKIFPNPLEEINLSSKAPLSFYDILTPDSIYGDVSLYDPRNLYK